MASSKVEAESIRIESERDLRKNIRAINRRFNDRPEIARLILVNPILALEDIGIELTPPVKDHIMQALRFPKRLRDRVARLEQELTEGLGRIQDGPKYELPLTDAARAHLLFRTLRLRPVQEDRAGDGARAEVTSSGARAYMKAHPFVARLAEYERLRQGALVFQPRAVYDQYKTGTRRHRWLDGVTFSS